MTTTQQAAKELDWPEITICQLGYKVPQLRTSGGWRGRGVQNTWDIEALRLTKVISAKFGISFPAAAKLAVHAKIEENRLIVEIPD